MKNLILVLATAMLSIQAQAAVKVYSCQLDQNPSLTSDLVVYSDDGTTVKRLTWMPAAGLSTTKSNTAGGSVTQNGIEFSLFGFQDQIDMLVLPLNAPSLPAAMKVFTYLDDDDHAVDQQNFSCRGN